MDIPSGWVQVLRGPRPKSGKWPVALSGRKQPTFNQPTRGRQPAPRSNVRAPTQTQLWNMRIRTRPRSRCPPQCFPESETSGPRTAIESPVGPDRCVRREVTFAHQEVGGGTRSIGQAPQCGFCKGRPDCESSSQQPRTQAKAKVAQFGQFRLIRLGLFRTVLRTALREASSTDGQDLLEAGSRCAEEASTACRRRRREVDVEEKRAAKALALVQVGELSSARQALEGADLAPGSDPNVAHEPILEILRNVPPEFELDEELFLRTLRSSKRGSAGRPSGMTNEHLRPLLDSIHDAHLLFLTGEHLAIAHVPPNIITFLRQGRLTALQKDNGGVRGIVAGEVIRRLVGRTMARRLAEPVKAATAPFQFALSTRL